MPPTTTTLRAVILYASSDAELQGEFRRHLTTFTKKNLIETWSFSDVPRGADPEHALQHALGDCDIVVLLVSADFSRTCSHQIDQALDCSIARGVQVIPILVRPLYLEDQRLRALMMLPRSRLAVSQHVSRDEAWTSVVGELGQFIHKVFGVAITTSQSPGDQEIPRAASTQAAMLEQIGTIVEFDPVDALGWIELDQGGRVRFGGTSLRGIDSITIGMCVEIHGTTLSYEGVPKAVAVAPRATPEATVDEPLAVWHRIRLIEGSAQVDRPVRRLEHHTIKSLHRAAIRLRLDRRVLLGGIATQFVATLPHYPDPASQMLADLHELNAAPLLSDGSMPLLTWLDNACILSECRSEFSLFSAVRQDLGREKPSKHLVDPLRSSHLGSGTDSASRENDPPKYYVYASPTKVRMLYDQLPGPVSQGPTVRTGTSLFSKSTLVCDHLRACSLVGAAGDGRPYFHGSLTMRWGVIRNYAAEIVFFGGDSGGTLVALVGSAQSLVGSRRAAVESGHSLDYYLFEFLSGMDERPEPSWLGLNAAAPTFTGSFGENMGVQAFNRFMGRVPHDAQRLEFVARTIIRHDDDGRRLIIGSPIYVALDDNAP